MPTDEKVDAKEPSRRVWFDGREVGLERTDLWEAVKHSPIETIVLTAEQLKHLHLPFRTRRVVEVAADSDLADLPETQIVMSVDSNLLETARRRGHPTCLALSIDDREKLDQAWQTASNHEYLVVGFDLPTNIPLELLIARLQGSKTLLFKRETSFQALRTAFGVLERGSDGVLLATAHPRELMEVSRYLTQAGRKHLELQKLVVAEVRHVGMGIRGCIDTCDLMTREEGMLVGSTSGGGVLVCSETHFLPYMNLRPFRVNAGAVHSYVWTTPETTEYITELEAGSRVLCVHISGEAREAVVGRVKIETRPLLLIRGRAADQEINVIIQDDWHVRVMGADGTARNVTTVRPGDELMAYVDRPGRHVGLKVEEQIEEQ